MKRTTIKDIARLAGVSVSTVSRALNNAPEINAETRTRILDICRKEGYRANLLARSLISSRTGVIGVIQPDIADPYHASLALHIETCARELDYQVMLCLGRPDDPEIGGLFDFLISQQVEGVILTSADDGALPLLRRYRSALPAVLLGAPVPEESVPRLDSVSVDNYAGGRLAAEYLHRLGHQRVVYLGFREGNLAHALRYRGFLSAASELGMEVETVLNPERASSMESGYALAQRLFAGPFPQTAAFAPSDLTALGAMQAADEAGIEIPGRLSLVGFDNIDSAALPKIRLTTVSQRPEALARSCVRLLLERIENNDGSEFVCRRLTPVLMERDTCAVNTQV